MKFCFRCNGCLFYKSTEEANQLKKCQLANKNREKNEEKRLQHILFKGYKADRRKCRTHTINELPRSPKIVGIFARNCSREYCWGVLQGLLRSFSKRVLYGLRYFSVLTALRNRKLLYLSRNIFIFPGENYQIYSEFSLRV